MSNGNSSSLPNHNQVYTIGAVPAGNTTWHGNITTYPNYTVAGGGGIWNAPGGGGGGVAGNWGLGGVAPAFTGTYNTGVLVDQNIITQISDRLKIIEDRLSVITNPDPEKLEKYAALKIAYENYKMLERLCIDTENPNET